MKIWILLKESMPALSTNLFWPAAAGNVAWAWLTVRMDPSSTNTATSPRLWVLGLLAAYLIVGSIRSTKMAKEAVRRDYWVTDLLHVSLIAWFAVAAQLNRPYLAGILTLIFLTTACCHAFGCWLRAKDPRPDLDGKRRWWLAGCNSLGMVVLAIECAISRENLWGYLTERAEPTYGMTGAVAVVLVVWVIARERLERLEEKPLKTTA